MTLEQIKNEYAISQGYGHWNELLLNNDSFTIGNLHLNKVMQIYARKCLELASENVILGWKFIPFEDYSPFVDKESITNENNIIK